MYEQVLLKFLNMKNSNYIINGILLAAVIVLFILQFTGKKGDAKHPDAAGIITDSTGFHLPIAYVRTDSLMVKYSFFNDMSNAMMKKVEDKKLEINKKYDKLAVEFNDFQQKAQRNLYITQERAMQEQERILRQKEDLDNLAAQIERELSVEQMNVLQQVQDTIVAAVKVCNTQKKYEMILCNVGTDNILYADDSYDITLEIVEFLNARYVPSKK
jgi:outer membrane protein